MILPEIALDEIDCRNETFRITEELDFPPVLKSLQEIGQLNPVCLLEGSSQKIPVCGFRRLRALRCLGRTTALARIIEIDEGKTVRAFSLAIWDNLSHRQLEPLEKARVLAKLKNVFRVPDSEIVRAYLPCLGLAPHESNLNAYLALEGVHPELKRCLAEGRLTLSSIETLAAMPGRTQDRFAALLSKIRLSASLQRKTLSLLEYFAAMNKSQPEEPLDAPEISAILENPKLSAFQKGEKLQDALYRMKNPRLSQAAELFAANRQRLGLPGSVQISGSQFFENPGVRVEFDVPNAGRFRDIAAALEKAAQSPDLESLFDIK
jgi:hypothetical protein